MLRNRSRAVTGKQALMADHSSQSSSSSQNYSKPIASFFGSPRFRAFAVMGLSETDVSVISPTSVLDSRTFSPLGNPFSRKPPNLIFSETRHYWENNSEAKAIGLALIEESHDSKPSKSVLFSAKLRVQIPQIPPDSAVCSSDSPKSPAEFGTKTRNSPKSETKTKSPQIVSGFISVSEMKLSEEYTCVRTHGPNPKTTHIFDNCIVKSFHSQSGKSMAAAKNFLSFCHTCKKNLEQTNDIYIYRGEKAFCSHECRNQEMLLDGADVS